MAHEQPPKQPIEGEARGPAPGEGRSLKALFQELANDTGDLIREEVQLAKLEMKEATAQVARDAAKAAAGLGLAAVGGLALTACLILVLGNLLDGAFWAGALIVGAVFLLAGGLLAWSAVNDLRKHPPKPDDTVETLKEDKRFFQHEAREFKRDIQA